MKIRPLTKNDIVPVANLHLQYLRTNYCGYPGLRLLQLYYKMVAHGIGACGFVAEDSGRITGFVCGVWDQSALKRFFIKNSFLPLGFWSIIQVIAHPSFLLSIIKRGEDDRAQEGLINYELRPIVVTPDVRGSDTARKLVERLFEDAIQKRYDKICLITEQDNFAAQKLYQKVGFKRVGEFIRRGTTYNQYERDLHTKS